MGQDITHTVFFELLRAGLWEMKVWLSPYKRIDFSGILNLAEEQSVVGLIAAGIEQVEDFKPKKQDILQLIGQALQIEQQNNAMNSFIGLLVDKMRRDGIYTLLLKGQGIAQCYARPLCRACGDVDFFLSEDNYEKAKKYLVPLAASVDSEEPISKHLGMTIDSWVVELHGSLRCGLSARIDKGLDSVYRDTFYGGSVRSWDNDGVQVFQLKAENDAIYVFTHILNHFYRGGIGVRQICDWSRLLWKYQDSIDRKLLETRITKMGLMTEWKAFGAFAVEYLGMPLGAMPFYSPDKKWKRKADRICSFIMEVGNFGRSRDNSYYNKPFVIRKTLSFGRRCGDLMRHARIFPMNSIMFLPGIVFNGLRAALKGE